MCAVKKLSKRQRIALQIAFFFWALSILGKYLAFPDFVLGFSIGISIVLFIQVLSGKEMLLLKYVVKQ